MNGSRRVREDLHVPVSFGLRSSSSPVPSRNFPPDEPTPMHLVGARAGARFRDPLGLLILECPWSLVATRWAPYALPLDDGPALEAIRLATAPHLVGADSELVANLALDVVLDNRVHGEFGARVGHCELRGELPMLIPKFLSQLRDDPSVAQFAEYSLASLVVEDGLISIKYRNVWFDL